MKKTRKAFTLVELLVVIAILAVLATVGIVGYTSFTKKAKESNDRSVIAQLNLALQANETTDGKPETMYEALRVVESAGFVVENLTPDSDGYDYVYDMSTNRFALMNNTTVVAGPTDKDFSEEGVNLWQFVAPNGTLSNTRSNYLKNGWSGSLPTISTGIDFGNNTDITSVNYSNTGAGKSVVLRTMGNLCVLTINAPSDHVDHYGYAKTTNVVAVNSSNSYHEFGTSNALVVSAGKVVIEETGVVFALSETDGSTATVSNNGGNVMQSTVDSVVASTTFEINSLSQLESFRDATNSGETFAGKTVNLNVNISLTKGWKPISNYYRKNNTDKWFEGTFNGNGHTISGLTNEGLSLNDINTGYNSSTPAGGTEYVYGLFASVGGNATIKNLKLANVHIVSLNSLLGDGIGALVGYTAGTVKVENVEVSGSIIGYDAVGGIIGRSRGTSITMTNCTNNAEVKAIRQCAGIVGQIGVTASNNTLTSCVNNGNVTKSGSQI